MRKFEFLDHTGIGKLHTNPAAVERYLDDLARVFDLEKLSKFKVVVDCCNGTSSLILRRMVDRFGLQFILINEKIEGVSFAHEPSINVDTVGLDWCC